VRGEIIVADNGSIDGSHELAESLGASVVRIDRRGYGAALAGGLPAAMAVS
jgi:glycosyltransferase involved in cell wall biosynthesis